MERIDLMEPLWKRKTTGASKAQEADSAPPNASKTFAIVKAEQRHITKVLTEQWAADYLVTQGKVHRSTDLKGFAARDGGRVVGLISYRMGDNTWEITSLNSFREKHGIGTALLDQVIQEAQQRECASLWLITGNDNTHALAFYQKRGFNLKAFYPEAITRARALKPQIPEYGFNGIPIRHEIELELKLRK